MNVNVIVIETIGWISTALFLFSILAPQRIHLHSLGVVTAITTGVYGYAHGATAIWVKWFIAFFFHGYMWYKIYKKNKIDNMVGVNVNNAK
ncbi:MAG: hypothetical protein K2P92_08070 [Bdellovibrionaceae bacterium]|nr:hypothetical protein [Pseudobdellovibrionaceae bacterium]